MCVCVFVRVWVTHSLPAAINVTHTLYHQHLPVWHVAALLLCHLVKSDKTTLTHSATQRLGDNDDDNNNSPLPFRRLIVLSRPLDGTSGHFVQTVNPRLNPSDKDRATATTTAICDVTKGTDTSLKSLATLSSHVVKVQES